MFSFKKKKDDIEKKPESAEKKTYIHLIPASEKYGQWEILGQAEVDKRVADNSFEEESRLFLVGKEMKITFEKRTHLE